MHTLVVSDLHVGAGRGRTLLDDPVARGALREAFAAADRVVLLGDVLELRERPLPDALAAASRVLPELVSRMAPGRELILLAGNHDHELFAPYFTRRGADGDGPLAIDQQVDWRTGEPLAEVAEMLGSSGASVTARYPGVWLRPDVYAHHGHYLDSHTTTPSFERLAAGAMARMVKVPLDHITSVDEYERVLSPIYAWMFAISQTGGGEIDASESGASTKVLQWLRSARGPSAVALDVGLRGVVGALGTAGLGSLSGDLSGRQLRRSALIGFGEVLSALGLTPAYALFGHTHRAGALPDDETSEWMTPSGVRLFNSGCWVREPAFVGPHPASSPYRPGFAIELDDTGPPRLVNLLDSRLAPGA